MSQTEVQLIKDAVIVNADVSNSAAIDISKISGAMPSAGGTFTDDVTFTGANYNISWDKSDNSLLVNDDARIKFGTGKDLHIYHNQSNSVIREEGTGNLNIQTTGGNVEVLTNTTETSAKFISNGAVELYHDNIKKLETSSTGAIVSGTSLKTQSTGAVNVLVGSTDASGAAIILDGDSDGNGSGADYSYIEHDSAGNLNIVQDNPAAGGRIEFLTGGAGRVSMQSDKFRPANNNAMSLGTSGLRWSDLYLANDLYMADAGVIRLGDSSDLLIQHTGNNNFIEGGGSFSGNLYLRAKLNENGIVLKSDDGVELYFDNTKRFETLSNGAQVQGRLAVGDDNAPETTFQVTATAAGAVYPMLLKNRTNGDAAVGIRFLASGADLSDGDFASIEAGHGAVGSTNHEFRFKTCSGGTVAEKLRILSSGGITFNGDSSVANALDDYEEGTWTPSISGTTSNLGSTSGRAFMYRKIGSVVFFNFDFFQELVFFLSLFHLFYNFTRCPQFGFRCELKLI